MNSQFYYPVYYTILCNPIYFHSGRFSSLLFTFHNKIKIKIKNNNIFLFSFNIDVCWCDRLWSLRYLVGWVFNTPPSFLPSTTGWLISGLPSGLLQYCSVRPEGLKVNFNNPLLFDNEIFTPSSGSGLRYCNMLMQHPIRRNYHA